MRPFFVRLGSKYKLREYIIKHLPDTDSYNTYVEPFAGSASIFFNLDLNHHRVILNDVDKELITAYKLIRTVNKERLPILHSKSEMNKLIYQSGKNDEEQLMAYLYKTSNSFMSVSHNYLWKDSSLASKVKRIDEVREKIKNVKFSHHDAINVIMKYDQVGTFMFIDPPYESSDYLYKDDEFDYEKLADALNGAKCKFMITLNDSKTIRHIFKGYNIRRYTVKAMSVLGRIAGKDRHEVMITNY